MKKYELTENIKFIENIIIYQIKALIDIPEIYIKAGELGGYIQHEGNLSHQGLCWVYDDAYVYGSARVFDNARVSYGNAQVYGDAKVFGEARVYDNARVYGNAQVYGDAKVYGDALVYGSALVYDNAHVYGEAWVCGKAHVYGKAALIGGNWTKTPIAVFASKAEVYHCDTNQIRIGCRVLTFNQWLKRYKEIGKENGYTDEQIKEYKLIIDFIINVNKI